MTTTHPCASSTSATPSSLVDLRSDTVTTPGPAMRQAMAAAAVGDDVWGEDPTVIELQRRVATLLGQAAALFVPSGTMANQIALRVHTHHGDEVLLGWGSHCVSYESGAAAALSGIQPREVGCGGLFDAQDVQAALGAADIHLAPPSLVWIENSHNRAGGRVWEQSRVEAIAQLARERGLRLHLDGARLLNAAAATRRTPAELAAPFDSLSICLSKGLGAPAGSVLAGSEPFIARARRYRKMLGGAMRQVGILAAAGLYALEHHVERLPTDHQNARLLAEGLAALPGVRLDLSTVETNIVVFDLDPPHEPDAFIAACRADGVLLCPFGPRRVRAVTHLDVDQRGCERAIEVAAGALRS